MTPARELIAERAHANVYAWSGPEGRLVMKVLIAADAEWVRKRVRAAFVAPGQEVVEVTRGQEVRKAFAEHEPDLVILDMQIGNMGGIACAIDLRLEESNLQPLCRGCHNRKTARKQNADRRAR